MDDIRADKHLQLPGILHRRAERQHAGDQEYCAPVYRAVRLLHVQATGQHHDAGAPAAIHDLLRQVEGGVLVDGGVDDGDLAAGAESRVDSHHIFTSQRRGHE